MKVVLPLQNFLGLRHVLVAANQVHQSVRVVLPFGQGIQQRLRVATEGQAA